jgi:hypothetical protein
MFITLPHQERHAILYKFNIYARRKRKKRRKEISVDRKRINFYQCDISDNHFFVRQVHMGMMAIHARTVEH